MKHGCLLMGLLLAGCASTRHCHYTAADPAVSPAPHVHVFLIHGLDPLDVGNLRGLRDTIAGWGYETPRLVQFFQGGIVIRDIARLKADDPQARILLFGFSAGAATSSWVINRLHHHHGINVDTVVYAAGITLLDIEYNHPPFIGKIIHIRDGAPILHGIQLTGAENYRFTDVWHFGSPTHSNTLAILQHELARLRDLSHD